MTMPFQRLGLSSKKYGLHLYYGRLDLCQILHNWLSNIYSYYTFVVYLGSSIIVPTYEQMIARYGISYETCYLSLALYIVGCKQASTGNTIFLVPDQYD